MDDVPKVLSAAEKHYQAILKANKEYYRRKNPEVKKRGRPRKEKNENSSSGEEKSV